jgi:hypothetical protein
MRTGLDFKSAQLFDHVRGEAEDRGRVYTMTLRQIYRSVVICIWSAKRGGP